MEECYSQIYYMRGQAMGGMPNVAQEGEITISMLERKPPLPKATWVRLVVQEDDKEQ